MSELRDLLSTAIDKGKEEEELEASIAEDVSIEVGRPHKDRWFRVHPGFHGTFYTMTYEKEIFLILDDEIRSYAMQVASSHVKRQTIFTAVTNNHEIYLWPIPKPRLGESDHAWWRSAREIASIAMNNWVRVWGGNNSYLYKKLTGQLSSELGEPQFGDESFIELLEKAFDGKTITSKDHEVLERL